MFKPGVRFWGADAGVSLALPVEPGVWNGVIVAAFGGGWETSYAFRSWPPLSETGSSILLDGTDEAYSFDSLNFQWTVGGGAELLTGKWITRTLSLYQGRWERYSEREGGHDSLFASNQMDREGLFENALAFTASSALKEGSWLDLFGFRLRPRFEAAFRWVPTALGNAAADYIRVSGAAYTLLRLLSVDFGALDFADRFAADWLAGGAIPLHARSSLGGPLTVLFKEERGLGGAVRAYRKNRFDGTIKIVNNAELRFSMTVPKAFAPFLVAYFDTGAALMDDDQFHALSSYGAAAGAKVLGLIELGYGINFALTPGAEASITHGLAIGTQFPLP